MDNPLKPTRVWADGKLVYDEAAGFKIDADFLDVCGVRYLMFQDIPLAALGGEDSHAIFELAERRAIEKTGGPKAAH